VTSNLALHKKKADHGQGVSGISIIGEKANKSFVIKILTSKPLRLKILQSIFVDPAPVKAFRGWGGGGTLKSSPISQVETQSNAHAEHAISTIFSRNFQS
jgi:hypothetical protein